LPPSVHCSVRPPSLSPSRALLLLTSLLRHRRRHTHACTMNNTTLPGGIRLCPENDTNATNCTRAEDFMEYEDTIEFEKIVGIVVPIVFSLIMVIGLVGNALVIIVVSCNPLMRNTTNVLIISLAISDLSFIIICVPFTATDYALPIWPFGNVWCKIVQYMINVCAYASVYTLVLMSLDRYLAVVHPIASMGVRTTRNSWVAIGILWAIILLCNIPALFIYEAIDYLFINEDRSACMMTFGAPSPHMINMNHVRIFHICFFVLSYFIPLTATCGLYVFMLKRLWYGSTPGGNISSESLRSKKRVTRMVVVVVVIFALCWLPIQIIFVVTKTSGTMSQSSKALLAFQIVGQCLAYTNSCVNPILYAFLSDNFRKGFKKVLCCGSSVARQRRSYTADFERTDCVSGRSATTTTRNGTKVNEKLIGEHAV
ncbi:PREDICTED: allatostatin-A receptor-like, partial [Priapulus caudatus]|uniref:Allatostatin-A receptor-like n=1 Tax=Priapulus caudatus TaxID=37621 RepID=A0ABM1F2D3_PRICU